MVFACLCASLLIDLGLYLRSHHSTSVLAVAVLMGISAVVGLTIAVLVAFRLTTNALIRLRAWAARGQSVYLIVALALMFVFGVEMRPEWLYAHFALTLAGGFVLGYDLLYADSPPLRLSRWWWIGVVLVLIITIVRILALSVYPAANIADEPEVLSWALSYLQRGFFTDTIMYYGGPDIQRFMLPVAWWISIVGSSYWDVRLFFFLLIFPLIAMTVLAARNWSISAVVTALVMFSSAVVMGGARIRHDIGLALAIAASLWLYTEALRRNKRWLHVAAGLAIGLGLFAHYHAALFGVALLISLYVPDYVDRVRQRQWRPQIEAILFGVGGLIGAAIVFLLQILPDWAGFLADRQPRVPLTVAALVNAIIGYWGSIALYSQLELLLVIVALAAALWRHHRIDIKLTLLLITLHLALPLQAAEISPQYVLTISPVYALLIGALFTNGLSSRKIAFAGIAAALFMVANLGMTLQEPLVHLVEREPIQLPTPPVAAWIRANVPSSESIVTEHWYYLFLTDYKFISPQSTNLAPLTDRLPSKEAMWDQIAPDVVVIDRNLSTCCVPQPIYDPAYLQSRGYQVVATLPGDHYPVLVYEKPKAKTS